MRFIYEQYEGLTEGYLAARTLDSEFNAHPAFIAFRKCQAVQRRKRLRRAITVTALFWALLPWIIAASILGSYVPYRWSGALSSLACLATPVVGLIAMGFTIYSIGLALTKERENGQWSVYWRWLSAVSSNRVPSLDELYGQFCRNDNPDVEEDTRYGAQGVWNLLHYLAGRLDDRWIALTNIMVTRSEDADVIIVGPPGIWVMESKYWSGYINIEQNTWSQVKVYYTPGGRRQTEYHRIDKHWDDQWLRQCDAIAHILRGTQTSFNGHAPSDLIGGGIALSHRHARLNADGSQKVVIGDLSCWGKKMRQSETFERLGIEDRLRIVDSLRSASQQYHRMHEPCQLTAPLAWQIYEGVVAEITKGPVEL